MNSWERLSRHVTFSEPPAMFRNHLRASLGDPSSTFRGIIESFMLGTGVPNTELFHVASAHFDSSVNVNDVGEPGYRAKHLCWATTGSYQKESDSGKISVCSFVYVSLNTVDPFLPRSVLWRTVIPLTQVVKEELL